MDSGWPYMPTNHDAMANKSTYSIQHSSYNAIGVNSCLISAQLCDFADNGDKAAHEAVQVGCGDSRGRELFCHCGKQTWYLVF